MSNVEDSSAVPKTEPYEEEEFSDSDQEPDGQNHTQEVTQVQKRKGGRKPIYATSEERKQRNRQAQAAFRERRTEYIKQLETTIKHHEETLQSLQQSHRSAADECLMLRYKNSLLERILLEKGIDVQAELRVKTEGSHVLTHPAANLPTSAVQKAVFNRHHTNRRALSGPSTKSIRPQQPQPQPPRSHSIPNPPPQPSKSPHGQMKPGVNDGKVPQRPQASIPPRAYSQPGVAPNGQRPGNNMHPPNPNAVDGIGGGKPGMNHTNQPNLYTPEYQAHLEQLEQDYDAQADLLEEDTSSDSPGNSGPTPPGPYNQPYGQPIIPPGPPVAMGMQGQPPMHMMPQIPRGPPTTQGLDPSTPYGGINVGFDPYDPNLDADPFGLTASMHFPTQFTYQENAARR